MFLPERLKLWYPDLVSRAGALYFEDIIGFSDEIQETKDELLALDWVTKKTARHEYFMSEEPRTYSYGNSGLGEHTYRSQPFTPYVTAIRLDLNLILNTKFNVCFLNKYDDHQQHLGWHADKFDGMVPDSPIAVVSYGAERYIYTKPKDQKGVVPDDQQFLLKEDSVFVMPDGYQDTHLHKIPKHDRPCGWRISLTFREFE